MAHNLNPDGSARDRHPRGRKAGASVLFADQYVERTAHRESTA